MRVTFFEYSIIYAKDFLLPVLADDFRFRFVFIKNHRLHRFLQTIAQNDQKDDRIILSQKILVLGQISNLWSLRVKFRS